MIEIGICDDEKEYRDMLYEMVVRSLFQFDEVEFRYYETGNQIIEEIEKNEFKCDLLLLDINMPGRNGLKTAEYIRTHQVDVDIIFVTVSAEHVPCAGWAPPPSCATARARAGAAFCPAWPLPGQPFCWPWQG